MITMTLGAAVAACAMAGAPNTVNGYRFHAPGHNITSDISRGIPLVNANVLNPQPFPYRRPGTVSYTNGGRLWVPATANEKILNGLYPGQGPVAYGAALEDAEAAFFLRPESEPWPDVALSPWQTVDKATMESIWRRRPWLQRSPARTDQMIREMRNAQNRFLYQQGLILHVRTHVSPSALNAPAGAKDPKDVKPSGVIRKRDARPNPSTLRTSLPTNEDAIRVSLPGAQTAGATVTVVRQQEEQTSENVNEQG